jgi:iron complex transport system ATP-binding protein
VNLIWTLRALNRLGYQIVVKAEPDFFVTAGDNVWTLKTKNENQMFDSIYELIVYLNRLKSD